MELEIDRLSIDILASKPATEHDLRLVVSVAKITPILERIADHASSIAEAAIVLNNEPQINSYVDFSLMANLAAAMLKEALDAFTSEDAMLLARSSDATGRSTITIIGYLTSLSS